MKEKRGISSFGLAALALLLALSVLVSGCSFTGRRGTGGRPDSSSSEEDTSDRVEVPDDELDDEDSSSDQPEDEDSSSSEESSKEESSSSQPASSSSQQAAASSAPAASGSQAPASSTPPASSTAAASSSQAKPAASSSKAPSKDSSSVSGLKNVTYVQKGAYTKEESFQDASIKGSGMMIQNKVFYGDVTVTSKAGDDGITLQDVDIRGTLTVQGGSDWLKLYGCKVGSLVVDYAGAKVFASQNTSVGSVTVKKNATLQEGELTGGGSGFEDIEVSGKSGETLSLTLKNLETGKLTTRSRSVVSTDKNTEIDIFNARAATRIRGSAYIGELTAYADGVYYDKRPQKLYTSGGADRPRPYDSDSGWEDDSSAGDDEYDWDKKDVSIDQIDDVSVERGKELIIRVDSNARQLSASSSDRTIAAVSVGSNNDRITVTAKKLGKAVITVKGTRSGYNADTVKFTVQVVSNASESPKITITSGDPAAWTNRDVSIAFRVSDTDLYEVTADGHTWRNGQSDYSFSVSKNGEYHIEAVDEKGNTAKATVKITHIDKQAPQITDLAAAGANITFKVSDDSSGVDSSKVQVKSSDGAVFSPTLQNGVYLFKGEAGKSYTVSAADKAGNMASAQPVSIQIDQKPVISSKPAVMTDADIWRQQKTVSFAVTFPDGMQPSIQMSPAQSVSGLRTVATSPAGEGYTICTYTFDALAEGDYTITATNKAGSASGQVHVAKVDRDGPEISKPVVENETLLQLQKKVTFRVTDRGAGVQSVTVDRDIGPLTPDKDGNCYFIAKAEGVYTIVATDHAGNVSTPQQVSVSAIGEPPAAEIPAPVISGLPSGPASGFVKQVTVSFQVTSQEKATVTVQRKEDGAAIPVEGPGPDGGCSFTALKNGTYEITAANGSKLPAQQTVTISNIDEIPPKIKNLKVEGGKVTFHVSDEGMGVQSVEVDEGVGMLPPSPNGDYSFDATAGKTYIITATDLAGLTSTERISVLEPSAPNPPDTPQQPPDGGQPPAGEDPAKVSIGDPEYDKAAEMPVKLVRFKVTGIAVEDADVTTEEGRVLWPEEDGTYLLSAKTSSYTITVKDKKGNLLARKTFTIENLKQPAVPVVIDGNDPDGWTAGKAMVRFTVSPAVPLSDLSVSGSTVQQDNGGYYFEAAANGEYTVSVKNGAAAHTFHVNNIDTDPVTVSIGNKEELGRSTAAKALERTVGFTVRAGESMQAGRVEVIFTPPSGGQVSCPFTGNQKEGYSFKADRNGTYTVKAENGAGVSGSDSVTLDNIGPDPSMIGTPKPSPDSWTNQDVTVPFTVQNAGQLSISVFRDGVAVASKLQPDANGDCSFAASQNGTYTITATSAYGDSAEKKITISNIDKAAPATLPALLSQDAQKAALPATQPVTTLNPVFSVSIPATEAGQSTVSVEYSLNGAGWTALPVPNAAAPAVGQVTLPALAGSPSASHALQLRAVDAASNIGQTVSYSITLNAAVPSDPPESDPSEEESEPQEDAG